MVRTTTRKSRKSEAKVEAAGAADYGLRIRHYCQGIGDCHLLSFPRGPGEEDFKILIDCGVHGAVPGGRQIVDAIVADLAKVTGKHIDVLVVTHEHIDHTSGFLSARAAFAEFKVDQVWMGWTEDGNDPRARAFDKYKDAALTALSAVSGHLSGVTDDHYVEGLRNGIDSLLGFHFGAKGDTSREARDAAKALGPVLYLDPKHPPIDIPAVRPVRAYVLGPSRDESFLKITDRASEMYGLSAMSSSLWSVASAFGAGALSEDVPEFDGTTPFDAVVGAPLDVMLAEAEAPGGAKDPVARFVHDHYSGDASQAWRRIDYDWAASGADLALQLDAKTNNTSLVLAFEFKDSGRVFLFTADAQIGSWLSWQDAKWTVDGKAVGGPDLLARTVYLKVGHHGSQNATAMGKGLELMTSPDLTAFVPTNEDDAKSVKWGAMPFSEIMTRLRVMTRGRVVRADDAWPTLPKASWPEAVTKPSGCLVSTDAKTFADPTTGKERCLYVEFCVR